MNETSTRPHVAHAAGLDPLHAAEHRLAELQALRAHQAPQELRATAAASRATAALARRALAACAALAPSIALAGSLAVSWQLPTSYTDGTPLPASDLAGTRVEYGQCAAGGAWGSKVGEVFVPAPPQSTTIAVTGWGAWCVRAYADTTATAAVPNAESAASQVASKSIATPLPGSPSAVAVK